jgi:nitrite reductase/ring-hydroxylating ferredoxin subunit
MAIRRRELIAGAVALAGMLWAGPAAFGKEISLGGVESVKRKAAKIFTSGSTRILVYRRTARKFSGFIASCSSDQTNLAAANVRRGRITCPTDSSVFNASTGRRISGPATTGLEKVPIKIANGFLVATIGAAAGAAPMANQLVESSKVPVGGGIKVESTAGVLMIVQPTRGKFSAYSAICTHAGCEVSRATAEAIICTCHGSEFSTANGNVLAGPAGRPLRNFTIVERSGMLFLS